MKTSNYLLYSDFPITAEVSMLLTLSKLERLGFFSQLMMPREFESYHISSFNIKAKMPPRSWEATIDEKWYTQLKFLNANLGNVKPLYPLTIWISVTFIQSKKCLWDQEIEHELVNKFSN